MTLIARLINRNLAKGSPYSITERMIPELISVLGSQPPQLAPLSARPTVIPTTLKRAAANFAAW